MLKKLFSLLVLFAVCITLVSCGDQQTEESSDTSVTDISVPVISKESNTLISALNSIRSAYSVVPYQLRISGCHNIDAVIPIEKLDEAAKHAAVCPAVLTEGFYEFEYNSDEEHSYDIWGQDILNETQTAVPSTDEDGDGAMESISGDLIIEGGGRFTRRFCYRVAQDASSGSSEMQSYLNGEFNGHERFDWSISDGVLCFSDAALAQDDFGNVKDGFNYILVFGMLSGNTLHLIEMNAVSETAEIPHEYMIPSSINVQVLSSIRNYTVSLTVKDGSATEMRDGRTFTYRLN